MNDLTFSVSKAAALTDLSERFIKRVLAALPDDAGVEQIVAAFVTATRTNATLAALSGTAPNDPGLPEGMYSINALHEMFDRDRETVRKMFRNERIRPAFQKAKLKGFRLTDKGKSGLTVREILEQPDDPQLTNAKIRSLEATARVKELEFENKSGAVRDEIMREVRDELTRIFESLRRRLVKLYWRENAKRLRRCKNDSDLQHTGETDQNLIFDELKRDYPRMFE
jgi:hypothetical protein